MTVQRAIEIMQALKEKHGGDIEVFFDCPSCGKSFRPGLVETVAMVKNEPTGPR